MTYPIDSTASGPNATGITGPRAGIAGRIAAFLGAVVILIGGAAVSVGMVMLAPLGMLLAAYVWRRRGRVLPVVGHWLSAMAMVAVLFLAFVGLIAAIVPSGTWSTVQHSTDSARVASAHTPPPAWIERMYPGASKAAAQNATAQSPTTQTVVMAYTMGFGGLIVVVVLGTIGWIGGMLLGLAVEGRWPGTTT